MLISSYPIFDRALFSGKSLLDLSLVQREVDDCFHLMFNVFT